MDEVLLNALDFHTAPGKMPEPILSIHVSTSIKEKIWVGQYIDLAYLLETQLVPEDDKAYEFSCPNNNIDKLSSTTASYTSWNKAFRVLIEIVALKWPDQCLPMVQYATDLCNNIGKFPFQVSNNYDVKFRLEKQSHPNLPWNEIDNKLWTKYFTGIKDSNLSSAFQSHKKGEFSRSDTWTCFDFNSSQCNRSICKFPHKCSKCFCLGHPQFECRRGAPETARSTGLSVNSTHQTSLQASNTNQPPQVRPATSRSS